MSLILSGFTLETFGEALTISLVVGLFNALIWPALIRLLLPITVLTLGIGSLLINGIFVVAAVNVLDSSGGAYIDDWVTGLIIVAGISIINPLFTRLLSIDDDDFYYRNIIRRQALRQKFRSEDQSNRTGVLFLEIDGLSHDTLVRAMRNGYVPNLAGWLRGGGHKLIRWECDWSSQTGAMQAGILHGNNWNMPLFRWYEKRSRKMMVSNHTKDTMELERRQSDGKGLLHFDGSSRANLFSGDAPHSSLTMSTVLIKGRTASIGADYMAFFSNPYNALRVLLLAIAEIFREIYQQVGQRRRDVQPRVHRGLFPYPFLRAFTNVFQRELAMSATLQDIYAGRPVIYSMFLGYDEVAHHSGTERAETLTELQKIDRAFGRLGSALLNAPRKYEVVVLSDHGQTQGATFRQRYGNTLGETISNLTDARTKAPDISDEGTAYVTASGQEMRQAGGVLSLLSRILIRTKDKKDGRAQASDIVVAVSGGLAGVSFVNQSGRAVKEDIDSAYPGLIGSLVKHEGVGFLLVDTKSQGGLVITKKGKLYIEKSKNGRSKLLSDFGPNALEHIKRTSSFPDCPDILINSHYWIDTKEVAAFEELVGSHGAMGGPQQYPFIMYPASLGEPNGEVMGAENVHHLFCKWLSGLGWESYEKKQPAP